ncbi:uncharacterized protein PAE49_006320 isoform 2-T2 [Odontesthes bonariensis]|uniref:uncharacterized protein cntrl isoform X1 n=1 Tax=Odontesthes bonariensis TaxID=219752 RepID=UPI003F589A6C
MSRKQRQLEARLDDLLSRIAMETQEIKELEQQLTDGQILANEALQRDLEGVISGLQENLRGLRQQAHRSQQQVDCLQAENQRLQRHLEDAQRHCRRLEDAARTLSQDVSVQQVELSQLRVEAQALRDGQVESSRRQAELEAELLQLREEPTHQVPPGQMKAGLRLRGSASSMFPDSILPPGKSWSSRTCSNEALRAAADQQNHNGRVRDQVRTRTRVGSVQSLQNQMDQTRIQLDRFTAALSEPQEEPDEARVSVSLQSFGPDDLLSRSLERLHRTIQQSHRKEAELKQSHLQLQDVRQERDALLQQLRSLSNGYQRSLGRLNRKLRQLSRFMCEAEQLTAEQLRSTTEQLRALSHTVELLHAQKAADEPDGDQHAVEQLKAELAHSQRETHKLRQKLDQIRTRTRTGSGSRTRTGSGSRTRTGAGDGGRGCSVPAGLSAPSLASQGTLDSGLGLQYLGSPNRGRPAAGGHWVYIPQTHTDSGWRDSGGGSDAGSSSRGGTPDPGGPTWLRRGPPAGGAAPEHGDTEQLEEEKKKLRLQTKELQLTLRRYRRVMQVCGEVECVEKTLLKRRAELRQADRKLLEAQSCTHTTRDQVHTQADLLQRRAQDGATCLLEASQNLRRLQVEAERLRKRRQEEEQTLREVEEELRSREQELQQLSRKQEAAADRLTGVLSDCQEAQRRLDSLTCQEERWKAELQREELRQQGDQWKARLRRRLWNQQENQQENLTARRQENQQSLLGLKLRLDQVDSLLTH